MVTCKGRVFPFILSTVRGCSGILITCTFLSPATACSVNAHIMNNQKHGRLELADKHTGAFDNKNKSRKCHKPMEVL